MFGSKLGARPWLAGCVVALTLASGVPADAWPASAIPSREDLKRALKQLQEVTNEYFDHPRSTQVQEYIANQHAAIRGLGRTAPDARRIADVIFRRGLKSRELEALQREFGLSVHEVEVVFAAGNQSEFARRLASQLIWQSNQSLPEILEKFVEDHRQLLAARAAEMRRTSSPADEPKIADYEAMVKSMKPLLVRVRVTAKADMLRLVSEEADVYAVIMNPSAESARRLEEMRDQMRNAPAIRDVTEL